MVTSRAKMARQVPVIPGRAQVSLLGPKHGEEILTLIRRSGSPNRRPGSQKWHQNSSVTNVISKLDSKVGGARCEILRAEILNALILAIVSCRRIPVGCSSRAVDGGMAESTEGGLPGEAPKL
jgi:hypothetical protein